ncbi:hypothetical protein O181_076831 [Austropuccinia psidii MF-1]|uniref:Uncharacterized protein n=1 Tax=Austropuccinia psidii MF-1 TaxID=1389203 RepID=A0A9Q3IBJ0_9BASI|nr:hypothetical protein [Austropuccinia psidii MF-1]
MRSLRSVPALLNLIAIPAFSCVALEKLLSRNLSKSAGIDSTSTQLGHLQLDCRDGPSKKPRGMSSKDEIPQNLVLTQAHLKQRKDKLSRSFPDDALGTQTVQPFWNPKARFSTPLPDSFSQVDTEGAFSISPTDHPRRHESGQAGTGIMRPYHHSSWKNFGSKQTSQSETRQAQSSEKKKARKRQASKLEEEIIGHTASSSSARDSTIVIPHNSACLKFSSILGDELFTIRSIQDAYQLFLGVIMAQYNRAKNNRSVNPEGFCRFFSSVIKGSLAQINAIILSLARPNLEEKEHLQELLSAFPTLRDFWNEALSGSKDNILMILLNEAEASLGVTAMDDNKIWEASWLATDFWNNHRVSEFSEELPRQRSIHSTMRNRIDDDVLRLGIIYYNSLSLKHHALIVKSSLEGESHISAIWIESSINRRRTA